MKFSLWFVATLVLLVAGCSTEEVPVQPTPTQQVSQPPQPKPTIMVQGKTVRFNSMTMQVPKSWEITTTPTLDDLSIIPAGTANCNAQCTPIQLYADNGRFERLELGCSGLKMIVLVAIFKAGDKDVLKYSICHGAQYAWKITDHVFFLASYDVPELKEVLAKATWT